MSTRGERDRKHDVAWRGETALRCLSVSSSTTPPRKEVAVEVAVVVDDEVPLDQSLQVAIVNLLAFLPSFLLPSFAHVPVAETEVKLVLN